MEIATKKIKIYAEEKTVSDGSGRKFWAYRAVTKNGAKITCKFRAEVKNAPKENCFINVRVDKMNMQRNTEFPTLWVSEIESIEPLEGNFDLEKNIKELDEVFG